MVSGIKVKFNDGKEVETKVYEREKAQVKYEDAIAEGKTAVVGSFLKTERSAIRILLGNFPPNSRAQLTVSGFNQLEIEDYSWCLRLPTTFTPRYLGNMPKFMATGASQKGN